MRGLVVLFVALFLAPIAAADHPGSNRGLSLLDPLGLNQVVHHLPDVQADFAAFETEHPNLVSRFLMGTTSSGFPLEGIVVTDEAVAFAGAATATGEKLRVYLDGGHHGNEFLGTELVMYYLSELLAKAGTGDSPTLQFLATTELYAVPIINVDGNFADTRKNAFQVDVNRNYDFQWGGPGSGSTPADQTYRGPSAASEAEVKANQEFGRAIRPDVWVTMHSGIAEFYWPWGWTDKAAPDEIFFESLEAPFEQATNGRIDAMQSAELYLAAGATDDWAYGVLGIPAHTFEVHEDQFIPVYGEPIPNVVADQLAGLDWVVRNVKHWGAWLEATQNANGTITLTNEGWNTASNVTVDGRHVPDLPPGLSTEVAWAGGPVHYNQMLINTSKVRTLLIEPHDANAEPAQESPTVSVAAIILALVAALVWARRR